MTPLLKFAVYLCVCLLFTSLKNLHAQQRILTGIVRSDGIQQPLSYAHVSVGDNEVGTLTNAQGNFRLKIPRHLQQDSLKISYLGYVSAVISLASLRANFIEISLKEQGLSLEEIEIPSISARDTIRKAWRYRGLNYEIKPTLLQGYYRENMHDKFSLKQFLFAEGVLELLKSAYHRNRPDAVRVIKGRKKKLPDSYVIDGQDYLVPHITQGPHLGLILDMLKAEHSFVRKSNQSQYVYEFEEVVYVNNRLSYVFLFYPKNPSNSYARFRGKIFLDLESLAFVRAEYELTEAGIELYNQTTESLPLDERSFEVNYMQYQGKWYLRDAKVFNQFYYPGINRTLLSEHTFLTTAIINDQAGDFPLDQALSINETFVEEVGQLEEAFWEEYNVVPLDQNQ